MRIKTPMQLQTSINGTVKRTSSSFLDHIWSDRDPEPRPFHHVQPKLVKPPMTPINPFTADPVKALHFAILV